MLTLGSLAFASPWILASLAALPAIWWLLRMTPPVPREIRFPALRLLLGLVPKEETPAHTPWWLLLLRLLLAALLIVALAEPLLNPGARLIGRGPVVLVIDDGWASAGRWSKFVESANDVLDRAERTRRPVAVITSAPPADGEAIRPGRLMAADEARRIVGALKPKPWRPDRDGVRRALAELKLPEPGDAVYVSDGIESGNAFALAELLQRTGSLQVIVPPRHALAKTLPPPVVEPEGLRLKVARPAADGPETVFIRAQAEQRQVLARQPVVLAGDARQGETLIELPTELRNRIVRIEIEDEASAGAMVLLDERWRRRPVGLVSGSAIEAQQPLLSEIYYLERALAPFTEVRTGRIADLLQRELALLVLADIGQAVGPDYESLKAWVERGGLLVRFAGPRLAEKTDDLMPVRLRSGSRTLGGAMSWSQPAELAPFAEAGPFAGLRIPADVTVSRQVLAEPDVELPGRTWAHLADGTPLITGAKRGEGWVVLIHTTANTDWSNLALSGLFIDLLRRLIDLSQGVAGAETGETLAPLAILDGFGQLHAPDGNAQPVAARDIARAVPGPRLPPGFYGREDSRRAINLSPHLADLAPVGRWPAGVEIHQAGARREVELKGALLAAAMVLGLADLGIALAMRGLLRRRRSGIAGRQIAAALALALAAIAMAADDALAQARPGNAPTPGRGTNAEDFSFAASLDLRLAYVLTGDADTDEMSRAGLTGLTDALYRRTSVEAGEPLGVNLERDEIAFFPFLYWPVVPGQRELSDRALSRIDAFIKTGGLILLDTRDHGLGGPGTAGPGTQRLRQLLARLDVPPLTTVPPDHVLTKAFYLMQDFPGRHAGGQVWVERHPGGSNDGVSALIVGSNDWAAAWAVDGSGRPLAAVVPGGPRQREMAYRFGINVVMYALTGNYKADQVHVPALLERLGQ